MGDFLQPREANLAEALGDMQLAVNEQRERADKAEAVIECVPAICAEYADAPPPSEPEPIAFAGP